MFVTADGIMAAYWPFWNLFQPPPTPHHPPLRHVTSEKQQRQSEMFFFFFFGAALCSDAMFDPSQPLKRADLVTVGAFKDF